MRKILCANSDQRTRKRHITKGNPFKDAALLPRLCGFIPQCLKNFSFTPHRALSGTIFASFAFGRTACAQFTISQPRRRAAAHSRESGLTATGFPALASIHSSSPPSPYALHSARFNFHFSAYHHRAMAFTSPNIGCLRMRPVQRPSLSSSRVAQTWISALTFRFSNSARSLCAIASARNSSVPVTSTIRSPFAACRATASTASGKKGASSPARFARRPEERIARRYALFPWSAYGRPLGARRAASASHVIPFRKEIFPSRRNARKYRRSSDGFSVSVPSISKNAARFMPLPLPFPLLDEPLLRASNTSSLQSTPAIHAPGKTPPSSTSTRERACESSCAHRPLAFQSRQPARASEQVPIRGSKRRDTSSRHTNRDSNAKQRVHVPTISATYRSRPNPSVLISARVLAESPSLRRVQRTKPAARAKPFPLLRNR